MTKDASISKGQTFLFLKEESIFFNELSFCPRGESSRRAIYIYFFEYQYVQPEEISKK